MTPRYRGKHLGLGVAVHARMCADATLTPEQALNLAQHDRMEEYDQLMAYAATADIDNVDVVVIVSDSRIGEACTYLGMDMCKMEPRMLREIELPVVVPRKDKKRDWEQRTRKQKRR